MLVGGRGGPSKHRLQHFYSLIYNLQPLEFGKIYNITLKRAKSTSTFNLFITNLQPNHQQIWAKSTIYKKGTPPPDKDAEVEN